MFPLLLSALLCQNLRFGTLAPRSIEEAQQLLEAILRGQKGYTFCVYGLGFRVYTLKFIVLMAGVRNQWHLLMLHFDQCSSQLRYDRSQRLRSR